MSRIVTNDQTLIDRINLDDTEAFEELYRLYWYGLYIYCLKKLQSSEDAKIVVRTIFTDLWEKRHTLPVSFSLSQYLYEEVRKTVVKRLSEKLADAENHFTIEKQFLNEFSVQYLQAASQPVSRKYTISNKRSELIRQQTGQTGTQPFNAFDTVKWILQSLTNKFSITHISSYPKN
jgi:DNA-directed RNA polymerase specialized sigma24 family protein